MTDEEACEGRDNKRGGVEAERIRLQAAEGEELEGG